MKLRDLVNEALFWGGQKKAFGTTKSVTEHCGCQNEEDGSYLPVDVRTKHDVQTEAKMDTKSFVKAVQDEFDVETLQLMQGVIQKQITLVNKMKDTANPRTTVKGFRKESVSEGQEEIDKINQAISELVKFAKMGEWKKVEKLASRIEFFSRHA